MQPNSSKKISLEIPDRKVWIKASIEVLEEIRQGWSRLRRWLSRGDNAKS